MFKTGPRNLITDVAGLRVGNSSDDKLKSGVTVVRCDTPAVAGVQVLGGAPGTRETDLLEPHNSVDTVNAIMLSGGSAFGLDAASGVQAALREAGIGFNVRGNHVPIVPGAILFDLANGGDKDWGRYPPYRELAYEAVAQASADFALGSHGGGHGATTVNLKGGLGSASTVTPSGYTIGALVIVNAIGSAVLGDGPHFWAAPFEQGDEFGGRGLSMTADALSVRLKGGPRENTTIALVATDATLTKPQAKRLAVMAHDGLARAIYPAHTPLDGDIVFAASTQQRPLGNPVHGLAELGTVAANVLARAIARAVYAATALPFPTALPGWKDKFGA